MIPILKKYEVKKCSIFGSFARGENDKNSDIDVLVALEDGRVVLDLLHLEGELEKELGRKIDLITYNSVNDLLKKHIFKDEIKIYG